MLSTRLENSVGKKMRDSSETDKVRFCQKKDGKKENAESKSQEMDWHKGAAMFLSYHMRLLCVWGWRCLCSLYWICTTFQLLKSQVNLENHLQAVWLCSLWNGKSGFLLWIRWMRHWPLQPLQDYWWMLLMDTLLRCPYSQWTALVSVRGLNTGMKAAKITFQVATSAEKKPEYEYFLYRMYTSMKGLVQGLLWSSALFLNFLICSHDETLYCEGTRPSNVEGNISFSIDTVIGFVRKQMAHFSISSFWTIFSVFLPQM